MTRKRRVGGRPRSLAPTVRRNYALPRETLADLLVIAKTRHLVSESAALAYAVRLCRALDRLVADGGNVQYTDAKGEKVRLVIV